MHAVSIKAFSGDDAVTVCVFSPSRDPPTILLWGTDHWASLESRWNLVPAQSSTARFPFFFRFPSLF